jgi:uncharacterized protein YciI
MIILSLTYKATLEDAEKLMEAHMDWVKQGYENGHFLASGRKVPRTGGIILAKGDRAEIERYFATDPFIVNDIAAYEVIEAAVSRTAPGLEILKS